MKLTKSDLLFLLESIDPKKWQAENLACLTRSAIYNNHLNIEGYERIKWTKFDPKDSKTFPPKSGEYLVCLSDDGYPMPTAAAWFNDSQQFNVSLPVAYWRHKPLPPVKTEGKIDSEHVDYEEYKRLKKENEELRKRLESLEEKNCEQWIKFDRGNPDTYPPSSRHFIGYAPGGYVTVMFRYSSEVETDEQFANNFSVRHGFTHWKPGPKAPNITTSV